MSKVEKIISLDNLEAVRDKFNKEVDRAIQNIQDEDTPWEAGRKINIEIEIKPAESRKQALISITVKSKLVAAKVFATTANLIKNGGKFGLVQADEKQMELEK